MSAAAIREYDGKLLLRKNLGNLSKENPLTAKVHIDCAQVSPTVALAGQTEAFLSGSLVVKPDQLIKRRGKMGLVKVNLTRAQVEQQVAEWNNKELDVQGVKGVLDTFIVEPFVKHTQQDEHYICIQQQWEYDEILFCTEGGVDIGNVDEKAKRVRVPIDGCLTKEMVDQLLVGLPDAKKAGMANFVTCLFEAYCRLYFTYLEINPIVMVGEDIYVLDLAAKLDQTGQYQSQDLRGDVTYPPPWGRRLLPEEQYIRDLDAQTGASLKLTVLNPKGKIWTMIAGGGASVIFTDTLSDLGFASEIANYGEYSGDPSEDFTYKYARTLFGLMCRGDVYEDGKVLIIGGGIANFTNVAATFKGIVRALDEYKELFHKYKVRVFVRRGGPNFREGLALLRKKGQEFNIPMKVYGPELHMTAVVPMAFGKDVEIGTASEDTTMKGFDEAMGRASEGAKQEPLFKPTTDKPRPMIPSDAALYDKNTTSIMIGLQLRPVQSMLDFDDMCGREKPSVSAIVYHSPRCLKFFWKTTEILIPCYATVEEALRNHPDVSVAINLESQRSANKSTLECLKYPQIKVISIIAEGIPERETRKMIHIARQKGVAIIGPATVGGIKPGCFRIANTGGMIDNIIASKLYRPGSVAYVSRSGGMSNELNNIVSQNSDGVYEGVAIGGDRFPGSTFMDHIMRYQKDENCKMIVVLGEHGGKEEYLIVEAIKKKEITKPIVAWCIGTCAKLLGSEVQFGHAGASANDDSETAEVKNKALREAGAFVPTSFNEIGIMIRQVFKKLVDEGLPIYPEPPVPRFKLDVAWANSLGLIRKPTNFICTISDDRGDEVIYGPLKLSQCFEQNIGIGGVIGCLWFKKVLPLWARQFIEMCVMMVADHGPAVSGAHNTIVASRAGKDLISSLVSGLMCIGPRFGGAIDDAAVVFNKFRTAGKAPKDVIAEVKVIPGIGHRVKSKDNPDKRVTILKQFIMSNFKKHETLDFALAVEDLTTQKKATLILNVDGTIGVSLVDMFLNLKEEGLFTQAEIDQLLECKVMNGFFVLGRSIGFIGHYLDQKRLNAEMFRQDTTDILYATPKK